MDVERLLDVLQHAVERLPEHADFGARVVDFDALGEVAFGDERPPASAIRSSALQLTADEPPRTPGRDGEQRCRDDGLDQQQPMECAFHVRQRDRNDQEPPLSNRPARTRNL